MAYTPQTWANLDPTTPVSADRLNHIESGIAAAVSVPTTPADGQVIAWNASLGTWVVQNPTGNALLAIGQNATGTTQTGFGASGLTDVTGCTVVAPANTARPVLAWAYCTVLCTATPTGTPPIIKIVEVSNGFDTPITAVRGAAAPISAANVAELVVIPMFQILPSVGAHDRTFKLQYQVPASNTASWVVENGANGDLSVIGLMVA